MSNGRQKFLEDLCRLFNHEFERMRYQNDLRCQRCGVVQLVDFYDSLGNGLDYSGI
jgi:hypothetical protein